MRTFSTGATRDSDDAKVDYEGFLSPLVIQRYGQYMNRHRVQADGGLRASDNWQAGIPVDAYMKSAWRHFMSVWGFHRGYTINDGEDLDEELCALLFNISGYLHERLKAKRALDQLVRESQARGEYEFKHENYVIHVHGASSPLPENHPLRHMTIGREHGE